MFFLSFSRPCGITKGEAGNAQHVHEGHNVTESSNENVSGRMKKKTIDILPVSVCIGATDEAFWANFEGLLSWLDDWSALPSEIVVSVSGVQNASASHLRLDNLLDSCIYEWKVKGMRVIVLFRAEKALAAENRNTAVRSSSSDLLLIFDMDDLMHPDRIRILFDHFAGHPESEAVLHLFQEWTVFDSTVVERFYTTKISPQVAPVPFHAASQAYRAYGNSVIWCCKPLQSVLSETYDKFHNAWLSVRKSVWFSLNGQKEDAVYHRSEDSEFVQRLFFANRNVSLMLNKLGLYSTGAGKKIPIKRPQRNNKVTLEGKILQSPDLSGGSPYPDIVSATG